MSEIAPDGSPVGLYSRLEPLGEPELIHAALPARCEILELGCGAGRITHRLVSLGHAVAAVADSAAMLMHVRGARTVLADLETLDLGRRFRGVVLASHFVNEPDRGRRLRFLETCVRHVEADGTVLIERVRPDWDPVPTDAWDERGGARMRLAVAVRRGWLVDGVMEYEIAGARLRHAFTSALLTDRELDDDLAAAGLRRRRLLDAADTWLEAVPAGASAIIGS
jgi:SAM-dependent methyltransferase